MILHRIRAWLDRSGPVPAAPADVIAARDTRIAQLEKQLSSEQFVSIRLGTAVERLNKENTRLARELVGETAASQRTADELARARTAPADTQCTCGGDSELYWRRQAAYWQSRSQRDRANARRLDDRLAAAERRPVIGNLS